MLPVVRVSFVSESLPRGGFGPSVALNDTLVGTTILVLDSEGNVVDEVAGLGVEF